jgi:hypothetical protein
MNNAFNEICAHCGLTYGAHHGGCGKYPHNCCPGHQGLMDWDESPGTTFRATGTSRNVPKGTPARNKAFKPKNIQLERFADLWKLDANKLEELAKTSDLYTAVVALKLDISIDQVTKEHRTLVKKVGHAFAYGTGKKHFNIK